jgi:hypothetical protein
VNFEVKENAMTSLKVYNLLGQEDGGTGRYLSVLRDPSKRGSRGGCPGRDQKQEREIRRKGEKSVAGEGVFPEVGDLHVIIIGQLKHPHQLGPSYKAPVVAFQAIAVLEFWRQLYVFFFHKN